MRSKNILFALLMIILALMLVSTVNALDNDTVLDDNKPHAISDYPDLVFEQSYDPKVVYKDNVFEVLLSVRNTGQNTYHNVSIFYPLPDGLELMIWPSEYENSVWLIDTLYPGELNTLTLVCIPKIANTTYEFQAIVDGETVADMEIYCEEAPEPEPEPVPPFDPDSHGGGAVDIVKSAATNGISLHDAGNPIFLLLFMIIFIPYIRLKY